MTAAAAKPTLHYFAFRGRAFASRVALFNALGKDGWIDQRVSLPRFQKQQQQQQQQQPQNSNQSQTPPPPPPPLTDYVTKTLPQLDLPAAFFNDGRSKSSMTAAAVAANDVTKLTQSHAIARYAAKLLPPTHTTTNNTTTTITTNTHFVPQLYPTAPADALLVDEAIAIVEQILLLTPKDADPIVKAQNRTQYYQSGYLRIGMDVLERRLHATAAGGPFLLGPQLTIGDLYLRAPLGDLFDYQQFEGIPASFYHEFPHIQQCAAAVLEHPLVKQYHQHYKN